MPRRLFKPSTVSRQNLSIDIYIVNNKPTTSERRQRATESAAHSGADAKKATETRFTFAIDSAPAPHPHTLIYARTRIYTHTQSSSPPTIVAVAAEPRYIRAHAAEASR